jgi:hypothetical protein
MPTISPTTNDITLQAQTDHPTVISQEPVTNRSISQASTQHLKLTTQKPINYTTMYKLTSQAPTLHTTAHTNILTTSSATKSTQYAPTHHSILTSQLQLDDQCVPVMLCRLWLDL